MCRIHTVRKIIIILATDTSDWNRGDRTDERTRALSKPNQLNVSEPTLHASTLWLTTGVKCQFSVDHVFELETVRHEVAHASDATA